MFFMAKTRKNIVCDRWLSNILKREVFSVGGNIKEGTKDNFLDEYISRKPVFIYAKVPATELYPIKFFEQKGFNLVDTNIILEKSLSTDKKFIGHCDVRFAVNDDQYNVVELAQKSFVYSRFHMDLAFPTETANAIKAEWAGNYFKGKRGDHMVVGLVAGKIKGFLQLLNINNKTLVIDLIAVDKDFRRKGIAYDMITYAESQYSQFSRIRVGTQLANIPSLKFYEKMGFKIFGAKYIFHYHNI
jgi:ribosomal protein S18 acetylase RimI-like enzyme